MHRRIMVPKFKGLMQFLDLIWVGFGVTLKKSEGLTHDDSKNHWVWGLYPPDPKYEPPMHG